ncbi:MAG TPA: phosphoenolpyruvate--protein phosphotransferase [Stellaceae bacterium]|jgi:phosphotransferase system enzyme I (PtsI)|nr:phosphoenolpyruvate--protein phosphotransferase [Stellaceae bacterium]
MKNEPGKGGGPPAESGDGSAAEERSFHGIAVSPGIAIGPAHVSDHFDQAVPEYEIEAEQVEEERARFAAALAVSVKQLRKLKTKAQSLPDAASEEMGYLLDAHLSMLSNSRLVRGVERRIAGDRHNAEWAVQAEIAAIGESFSAMRDAYLAERFDDIRIVGMRLIRNLAKRPFEALSHLTDGTVILAEELTPADTALMDPRRVAGFATVLGGAESHTSIMARALGLPAVVGVAGLLTQPGRRETVIVDGSSGIVVINPGAATITRYRERQDELRRQRRQLDKLRRFPAITRDGVEIALEANLELPRELDQATAAGATGLGLVRSEFLYMNRDTLPSEDEQFAAFRDLLKGMEGRPVTVRTLDIGGEKIAEALSGVTGAPGANPALGLRAIRLSLKERKLLDTQLAAMLRAAAYGKLRILLPMICNVGELRRVREALVQVARRLRRRGIAVPETLPPLGVMIEIPGAALAADALAAEADFFALGTNDLIQYTLAIDRGDEQVAYLYDPLHPAVLRLIQFAIEAAHRARIPISVCGEMAGDPRFSALLIGLGLRELSMAPSNIPRVKQRIRSLDTVAASRRARAIMDQWDSGRIAALLDDFNALA